LLLRQDQKTCPAIAAARAPLIAARQARRILVGSIMEEWGDGGITAAAVGTAIEIHIGVAIEPRSVFWIIRYFCHIWSDGIVQSGTSMSSAHPARSAVAVAKTIVSIAADTTERSRLRVGSVILKIHLQGRRNLSNVRNAFGVTSLRAGGT